MKAKSRRLKYPHLLGSKWTALQAVMGWRHFRVRNRQDRKGGLVFAELQSVCDPTVRFWINARSLRNRDLWQAGWLSLAESPDSPLAAAETPRSGPSDRKDEA